MTAPPRGPRLNRNRNHDHKGNNDGDGDSVFFVALAHGRKTIPASSYLSSTTPSMRSYAGKVKRQWQHQPQLEIKAKGKPYISQQEPIGVADS